MRLDLNVIVDVHDLREERSLFQIEEVWSEKALSCFDNLLVIDGVFNLNLFMDLCSCRVELG